MPMNYEKAAQLYLSRNSKASSIVDVIAEWDEKKTIRENAQLAEMTYSRAAVIARRFSLRFQREVREGVIRHTPGVRDKQRVIKILALKLKSQQIADYMRMKVGYVERLLAGADIQVKE